MIINFPWMSQKCCSGLSSFVVFPWPFAATTGDMAQCVCKYTGVQSASGCGVLRSGAGVK